MCEIYSKSFIEDCIHCLSNDLRNSQCLTALICVRIFILISSILPFSVAKILKRRRSHFEEKTALSNGANDAEVSNHRFLAKTGRE